MPGNRSSSSNREGSSNSNGTQQHPQQQQPPRPQQRNRRPHPPREAHGTSSKAPPSELDRQIWGARSAGEVLQVAGSSADLTPASAASVLSTLARLLRGADAGQRQQARHHPALPRMYDLLQHGAPQLPLRSLVGVLQQCVWLGLRPPQPLLAAVTEQLVRRLPAAAPTDACHAAWALTRLSYGGISSLLGAIDAQVRAQAEQQQQAEQQAEQQQQEQQQQEEQHARQQREQQEREAAPPPWLAVLPAASLVNLLWACGKASYRSQPLQEGIARALLRCAATGGGGGGGGGLVRPAAAPLASLTPQQLSMLFYSMGQLHWVPSEEFLRHAAAACRRQLPSFTPQGLSNVAWGISRLPRGAQPGMEALAAALAAAAAPRLAQFGTQELSMLVTAAAAPGPAWCRSRAAVVQAAAGQIPGRAHELSERDLVGMLSAFATVRYEPPAGVLDAACRRLAHLLPAVPAASLSWLLWSLARMPRYRTPRPLLHTAEAALRGQAGALHGLEGADLARLCWGLGELHYYSGALLADLACAARGMWEGMEPQSMAMVLHSFAQQQFTPHELLDAAAEHLAANLERYSPQAVAVVMWSFGRLGVHPGRGLPGGGPCTPHPQDGTPLLAAVAACSAQRASLLPPEQQGGPAGSSLAAGEAFSLQGLSMLLWAFATLEHHPGEELLAAVSARFVQALRQCQPRAQPAGGAAAAVQASADAPAAGLAGGQQQGTAGDPALLKALSNTAWSFSKFGFADDAFFWAACDALPALLPGPAPSAPAQQHEQQPQEQQPREQQPRQEGHQAEQARHQGAGEAHSISSLAFAAAKLRVEAAPPLLTRLLPAARARLGDCSTEELCQLLWALAHAGVQPPLALLDAAAQRLAALVDRAAAGGGACPDEARLLCMVVHALAGLAYRADAALLDACVAAVAGCAPDVSVSLLAKLVWGCAHVGHDPAAAALEAVTSDLYHRLSHSRGNSTVLNTPDLVHLLWGLAALQQYHSQLYRAIAYRATRLPDGVPDQPQLRRMLREATVLHSCEHRLNPVAAKAAAAILPAWMAEPREEQGPVEQQDGEQQQEGEEGSAGDNGSDSDGTGLAAAAAAPRQQDLRAAAEAACRALQRAGVAASLKQLSFGDFIVVFGLSPSGESGSNGKRRPLAAVVPATTAGRAAVNAPHQLLGSALVSQRVLSARGLPVVPGVDGEEELVAHCRGLLAEQR